MKKAVRALAIDTDEHHSRSRADFVYESLRDAIADGRMGGGQRVREEEIASKLGVSRTPVREALHRLHQSGLLEFGGGRGVVVSQLSHHQVLQLYAMREILEGSAARFAAQHADKADIAILYRLQKELADAKAHALILARLNRRFHQAIYEAAHNQYLSHTLNMLHDSFALLQNATVRLPSRRAESDEEHRRIVSAIERRNPEAAEKAARNHIRQAQRMRFEKTQ